jgi:hypothetical protein
MDLDEQLEFESLLQKDLPTSSALLSEQKALNTNSIATTAAKVLDTFEKESFVKFKRAAGVHINIREPCSGHLTCTTKRTTTRRGCACQPWTS